MSLYEILGVDKNADADAIKKAHRAKAKQTHPDSGGDRADFEAVQRAYIVLSDPLKRDKYDRTGDESDDAIDNTFAEMASKIVGAFNAAMRAAQNDFIYSDMIEETREQIENSIEELESKRGDFETGLKTIAKIKKRLSFKASTPDFILRSLENDEKALRANIEKIAHEIEILGMAIEYLKHYGFEFDQRPQEPDPFRSNAFAQILMKEHEEFLRKYGYNK